MKKLLPLLALGGALLSGCARRPAPAGYQVGDKAADFQLRNADAKLLKTKYLANALRDLLAGRPVATPTTQAIGCSIKWKEA